MFFINFQQKNRNSGSKKILEINAGHPIMKELLERVKESPDTETEELVRTLTETALINSIRFPSSLLVHTFLGS